MNYSHNPAVLIFSVFQASKEPFVNKTAHTRIKMFLEALSIPFKELEGCYKGVKEASFLVMYSDKNKAIVDAIAKDHNQECYMLLDEARQATLVYSDRQLSIGKMRALTDGEQLSKFDGYSVSNGVSYIIE